MTQLLTRTENAQRLGVSYETVRDLVKAKKLRDRRLPSARGVRSIPRYSVADIEAYITSGYAVGLR